MSKPERFVMVADNHGDMVDPASEVAVKEFIADFKPTVRIHLGDVWDFRCLRKGASEGERSEPLDEDWEAGNRFLKMFFRGGRRKYLLRGNHDERLWEIPHNQHATGESQRCANKMLDEFDTLKRRLSLDEVLPYDSRLGVLHVGHMKCIHGYHAGESSGRQHARIYGNVCYGHTHTIETATVHSYDAPKEARGIGACCTIDMLYNSRQTNKLRHANGFAYGYMFNDGSFQIFQTRKIGGLFYAASDVKVYGQLGESAAARSAETAEA
jgi:predicted phosphodiesterase